MDGNLVSILFEVLLKKMIFFSFERTIKNDFCFIFFHFTFKLAAMFYLRLQMSMYVYFFFLLYLTRATNRMRVRKENWFTYRICFHSFETKIFKTYCILYILWSVSGVFFFFLFLSFNLNNPLLPFNLCSLCLFSAEFVFFLYVILGFLL